jgi:hypothetical protein
LRRLERRSKSAFVFLVRSSETSLLEARGPSEATAGRPVRVETPATYRPCTTATERLLAALSRLEEVWGVAVAADLRDLKLDLAGP